ncbi:MAG: outer membrane beta-barrel protein [Rikenellaceae bacterium]
MKKITITLLLGVVFLVCGVRETKAQAFYFGVRAGANFSYVSDRVNSTGKFGGNFGGLAGYQISSEVAVQGEVLYSFQGYMAGNPALEGTPGDYINLDYLKIPLIGKLYLIDGLNFEAGVSFNFLCSALQNSTKLDGITGFDVSIPVGLAYKFTKNIEAGLRWDISLIKINEKYTGAGGVLSLNAAWIF